MQRVALYILQFVNKICVPFVRNLKILLESESTCNEHYITSTF